MFGSETTAVTGGSTKIDWGMLVVDPLKDLLVGVIAFIPNLVKAGGILLIGWLVSILVMNLMRKFLKTIHFDRLAQTTGMADVLDEKKLGMNPNEWISKLFFWFGIIMTWIMALDALRLRIPAMVLDSFGHFMTMVFTGVITFLLGLFLSMIASKFVESTARELKAGNPVVQAAIIRWAIILFTFVMALSYFGLPSDFVLIAIAAVGITLCVTFAIAFGAGSIPVVPKILDKWIK